MYFLNISGGAWVMAAPGRSVLQYPFESAQKRGALLVSRLAKKNTGTAVARCRIDSGSTSCNLDNPPLGHEKFLTVVIDSIDWQTVRTYCPVQKYPLELSTQGR